MKNINCTSNHRMKLILVVFIFILSSCFLSCTHGTVSSVQESIRSDKKYSEVLDKVTKTSYVTDVFESLLTVHVSYFSEEFKQALEERYKKLFNRTNSNIVPSNGVSFIVSVYTNDKTLMNLEDRKIWSIFMEVGSNRIDDFSIRAIPDKNRVKPFFNYINNWSREYLITFSTDTTGSDSNVKLFLSNPEAKVELKW